jgi:zinc protease
MKTLDTAKSRKTNLKLLADTRSRLKYDFAMHIDNPTSIAESLAAYTWLTGDPESLNRLYALYDKVTADDLVRVAKKYFVNTGLTVATISPAAEIEVK